MNIKYQIIKTALKLIPFKWLPHNKLADNIWSLKRFIQVHKRLPTKLPIYNDVLFNIKISDEITDPLRIFTTDKEFVKLFVKAVISDKYNIPTLAVLHSAEEVDSYNFPSNCCIKPTHASGEVIFHKDNIQLDTDKIKAWFKLNYYDLPRERNYKSLNPKIIVEPLVFNTENPSDYKFFCFKGKPKMIQVDFDRFYSHSRNLYDANWNEMDFSTKPQKKLATLEKPKMFDEMLVVAEKLSSYFSFVRIDFYTDGQQIFVGEITHCAENALGTFYPVEAEINASKLIFS